MQTANDWYTKAFNAFGQPKLSLEYANKTLELDPNFAGAYYIQGVALNDLGQKEEAIKSFDKAISIDPSLSQAYYCKGNALVDLKRPDEGVIFLDKAISLDPNLNQAYYVKGNVLADKGKYEEAIEYFDIAISLKADFHQAYHTKGNALANLNKIEEAIACFDKAISLNSEFSEAYYVKGNALATLKKTEEAIDYFDQAILLNPKLSQAYYTKGNALAVLKKTEEAIIYFDQALEIDPKFNQAYYTKGNALVDLKRTEEAYGFFTKGIELDPENMLYYCGRGRCLTDLGREQEALKDFAKAQELLKAGNVSSCLREEHIKYVEKVLKSIVELQNISNEAEAQIKQLEVQKDNPVAKKFVAKMQVLMEKKNKIAGQLVGQFGKDGNSEMQRDQDELAKLKKQFQEEMEAMKVEINNIKGSITELKNDLDAVKEDLSTKLNDYKAKLDKELNKLDIGEEDKEKIREYYRAFLETFSSAYVTSQIVDSGQVSLKAKSTATSILSVVASYAPVIGSVLASGVKNIGEFLKSREMINNARKMKGLAADSTELSQLVCKTGYEIVLHPAKFKKIIHISDSELEVHSANLLGKIREFCQKMGDEIDEYLYTRMYKTPAARLGHMDANKLIELWLKDQISPYNIQKLFVERIVISQEAAKQSTGMAPLEQSAPKADKESLCRCNMF